MKILSKGTNSTKNSNSKNIFKKRKNTLCKNNQKYEKVVYEEESDCEPEEEESKYIPEETEEIEEPKKEENTHKKQKLIFFKL